MPKKPLFWPAILFAYSVFAVLPSPQNLWVDAVNMRYILRWDWNHSPINYNVTFTAAYTFSNVPKEKWYTCTRESKRWCDFSALDYSGSYVLLVRAEVSGKTSNWTSQKFVPDEDAILGAPTDLKVEASDAMLTASFNEPTAENGDPMSDYLGPMAFRLRYWPAGTPNQKQEKLLQVTHCTLTLEPFTEYCLQVNAFHETFNKISNYTQPQCVTTLGHIQVLPIVLAVNALMVLIIGIICLCHRKIKRLFSHVPTPNCILEPLKSDLPLLEPDEMTCNVTTVIAMKKTELQPM